MLLPYAAVQYLAVAVIISTGCAKPNVSRLCPRIVHASHDNLLSWCRLAEGCDPSVLPSRPRAAVTCRAIGGLAET